MLDYPGGTNVTNHKQLYERRESPKRSRDVENKDWCHVNAKRGTQGKECGKSLEAERGKDQILPCSI